VNDLSATGRDAKRRHQGDKARGLTRDEDYGNRTVRERVGRRVDTSSEKYTPARAWICRLPLGGGAYEKTKTDNAFLKNNIRGEE